MKIFVFRGVLDGGMAVIAANSREHAQELAHEKFKYKDESFDSFMWSNDGFDIPVGEYKTSGVQAGVLHS